MRTTRVTAAKIAWMMSLNLTLTSASARTPATDRKNNRGIL